MRQVKYTTREHALAILTALEAVAREKGRAYMYLGWYRMPEDINVRHAINVTYLDGHHGYSTTDGWGQLHPVGWPTPYRDPQQAREAALAHIEWCLRCCDALEPEVASYAA